MEKGKTMSDLISRQAAIDIVSGYAEQFNGYIGSPNDSEVYAYARGLLLSIERNINAVPSVKIVRCKDCKYYNPPFEVDGMRFEGDCDFHDWYRCAPTENDFCSVGVRKDV